MKKIFTSMLFLLIVLFCPHVKGQTFPSDHSSKLAAIRPMNAIELSDYRRTIWENLPAAVGWVNDFAGIFTADNETSLEALIAHFEQKTSIEIMIVTVDTNMIAEPNFKYFSNRLLHLWGIGKIRYKNGIVILICRGYQQIEVTCDVGIDKLMTETQKAQIIKKYIIPYYQEGNFYEGTLAGLKAFISQLTHEYVSY